MNAILAIPLPLRFAALVALGAVVGGFVNWATYTLAWNRRAISPWSAPPPGVGRRGRMDRVPILGWWLLARESQTHGRGFWLRPMLVEVATGALFGLLYLIDTEWQRAPLQLANAGLPRVDFLATDLPLVAHVRYVSHVILLTLMLVASLVDLDEKTIPDSITVLGTLAALALAVEYPWSLLPAGDWLLGNQRAAEFLTLASPQLWPATLDGLPQTAGLLVALGCWTLWCGGLLPRIWKTRRGWAIAARIFVRRLRVDPLSYAMGVMWIVGAAAIWLAASRSLPAHWAGLVTSLVGMAAGGGIVWAVRFIGGLVLGKEAMGFGDVTLMSMIGAFLGWQACLMIFFVAPFVGLVYAIVGWILHREHELPYGPWLCLAALGALVVWPEWWQQTRDVFALGWLVPAAFAVCMGLLAVLLWIYKLIADAVTAPPPSEKRG